MRRVIVGAVCAVVMGLAGCSTMKAADKLHEGAAAFWSFVRWNGPTEPGIYYCERYGGEPVCWRARVVDKWEPQRPSAPPAAH